jgi:hypothetical protein
MKGLVFAALAALVLGFASIAHAEGVVPLVNNGNGLIYDPNLKITWYDYSYDGPSGTGATWAQAMAWAASLTVGGTKAGSWSLPTTLPVNGSAYDVTNGCLNGSTDKGYNICAPGSVYAGSTASQLSYLFYTELGNKGNYDVSGNELASGTYGLKNTGPFTNLLAVSYLSATEYEKGVTAFNMSFYNGDQFLTEEDGGSHAIAVHPGNVGAPARTSTTLSLSSGWNLVSLPLQQAANASAASLLSGIKGACEVVWAYSNQAWQVYDPNDTAGSTLTSMQAGMGYWVKMTSSEKLSVSGTAPSTSVQLSAGWNFVGYNGTSCVAPSTALSGLTGLQVVWGYPSQGWQFYDPANSSGSGLTQLCPGAGYWIDVNQAATWSAP